MKSKAEELRKIAQEIEKCKICRERKSGKAVPGEGNPDAKVVFIGEAPGRKEAETGRPFVGRSGEYLRSKIYDLGFKDEDVFITSPVKYLPNYGTPTRQDIEHGMTHLQKQLDVINPKIIVLLGSVAAFGVLGDPSAPLRARKIAVLKLHGTIIDPSTSSGQVHRKYFLTLHPAAAIRFPIFRKIIEKDFKKLKTLVS